MQTVWSADLPIRAPLQWDCSSPPMLSQGLCQCSLIDNLFRAGCLFWRREQQEQKQWHNQTGADHLGNRKTPAFKQIKGSWELEPLCKKATRMILPLIAVPKKLRLNWTKHLCSRGKHEGGPTWGLALLLCMWMAKQMRLKAPRLQSQDADNALWSSRSCLKVCPFSHDLADLSSLVLSKGLSFLSWPGWLV